MENFTFFAPAFSAFGKDTEFQAGKLIKEYGGTKGLVHYGANALLR